MSDDGGFVDTGELFAAVEELRETFTGAAAPEALSPGAVPSMPGADSVTTAVTLAAALPGCIAAQLELAARTMTLGGLQVIAADRVGRGD